MFTIEMSETTNYLFKRSTLTLFFPSLLFWGGLLAVCVSVDGLQSAIDGWLAQGIAMQGLQLVGALIWVAFSAHLLGSHLSWITRQFEGYWTWPFGDRLYDWRQAYYKEVLKTLNPHNNQANVNNTITDAEKLKEIARKKDRDYEQIYYRFPFPDEPDEVMPTRLGNILKNAELYPYHRYDIDAVLIWPRLYPVLPDRFLDTFQRAKSALDLLLVISFLSGLFALIAAALILIWFRHSQLIFLTCFIGGLLLAWIAYQAALEAAVTYCQLVKSAFDLYKGELLNQLGYERPKSLAEEREFWQNLCQLIYRADAEQKHLLEYPELEDKTPVPSPVFVQAYAGYGQQSSTSLPVVAPKSQKADQPSHVDAPSVASLSQKPSDAPVTPGSSSNRKPDLTDPVDKSTKTDINQADNTVSLPTTSDSTATDVLPTPASPDTNTKNAAGEPVEKQASDPLPAPAKSATPDSHSPPPLAQKQS